jgi:Tfp pilus assembly protein PilZ
MATGQARSGYDTGTRSRNRVEVGYSSWDEFLAHRLDLAPAGLFLAGSFDVEVGEDIEVRCTFPGDADGATLSGRVLWRRLRAGSDLHVRAGIGVVLRSASMAAYRRLIERAEGGGGHKGRRQERFAFRIPASCTFGRRRPIEVEGSISDVSERGLAVTVGHRPSVGDAVFLRVDDRLLGAIDLAGFVSWVRPAHAGAPGSSIGVELQFPRDDDRHAWERVVARAKAVARESGTDPQT